MRNTASSGWHVGAGPLNSNRASGSRGVCAIAAAVAEFGGAPACSVPRGKNLRTPTALRKASAIPAVPGWPLGEGGLLAAVAFMWEAERVPGIEAERAHAVRRRSGMKHDTKRKGRRQQPTVRLTP